MKLFYADLGNFGDQLNPFIFGKLMPNFFDEDKETIVVGIGTLFGFIHKCITRRTKKIIIFTSGYGYGTWSREKNIQYDFIAVRGPLTAKKVGIDLKLAVVDGGVLIKELYSSETSPKNKLSFIPHYMSLDMKHFWEKACERLNICFIDPTESPEIVLKKIINSEMIIAESLHGAIVAEALRIPWLPIKTNVTILDFKWQDWCSSLNLEYNPAKIHFAKKEEYSIYSILSKIKLLIKPYVPSTIRNNVRKMVRGRQRDIYDKKIGLFESELGALKSRKFVLSSNKVFNEKYQLLIEKLEYLKNYQRN